MLRAGLFAAEPIPTQYEIEAHTKGIQRVFLSEDENLDGCIHAPSHLIAACAYDREDDFLTN